MVRRQGDAASCRCPEPPPVLGTFVCQFVSQLFQRSQGLNVNCMSTVKFKMHRLQRRVERCCTHGRLRAVGGGACTGQPGAYMSEPVDIRYPDYENSLLQHCMAVWHSAAAQTRRTHWLFASFPCIDRAHREAPCCQIRTEAASGLQP